MLFRSKPVDLEDWLVCADEETEVEVVTGRTREAGTGDGRWRTEASEAEQRVTQLETELLALLDAADAAVQAALAAQRAKAEGKGKGKRKGGWSPEYARVLSGGRRAGEPAEGAPTGGR